MKNSICILGQSLAVNVVGDGDVPLLVLGPATLFLNAKNRFAPDFFELFTVYFLDVFAEKSSSAIDYSAWNLCDFVAIVDAVRQSLELSECALFAHSALGILAIEYARQHPDSVLQIILVATAPVWGEEKTQKTACFFKNNASEYRKISAAHDAVCGSIEQRGLESAGFARASHPFFVSQYRARRAHFFYNPHALDSHHMWDGVSMDLPLINRYFSLLPNYVLSADAFPMVPTFIGLGLYDASVPVYAWTDDYNSILCLPQVAHYIFSESGHYPMWENSQLFVEQLTQWMCPNVGGGYVIKNSRSG